MRRVLVKSLLAVFLAVAVNAHATIQKGWNWQTVFGRKTGTLPIFLDILVPKGMLRTCLG